MKLIII